MKKHICLGGPYNGQFMSYEDRADFIHSREYHDFNSSGKPLKGYPSMVWLHEDLIKGRKAIKR